MTSLIKSLLILAIAATLNSCGTTSQLQTSTAINGESARYSKVIVKDFTASVVDRKNQINAAKTYFPDRIAQEIRKTGKFTSVTRSGTIDSQTLVVHGNITRYQEGSAALRLLVGLGAGSSYFDSTVLFRNGSNNKRVGTIQVDKNSWALGGGLAAGQTPMSYMDGAAKKIAKESIQFAH